MKYLRFLLGFGLLAMVCAVYFGVTWIVRYQSLVEDEPEIVLKPDVSDLTYCVMGGKALKLDLYLPLERTSPAKLLVYIHGGSFTSGDKRVGSGVIDIPAMTGRGFAVAAVNYRLMPEDPFPAEIQDVKCAIRFLRAHAEEYGLDTSRIGVWGGSAGGHLAAMLGLTNGDQTFEVGDYLDQSSSVDAVVEMFGPTDLTAKMGWLQRMLLRRAFGTDSPGDPRLAEASPVRYVQGDEPPFLVIHGEDDSAVPLEQAEFLYHALRGAGSPVELMVVGNANHNFKPTGGPITPDRAMISTFMGDFFAHELR